MKHQGSCYFSTSIYICMVYFTTLPVLDHMAQNGKMIDEFKGF